MRLIKPFRFWIHLLMICVFSGNLLAGPGAVQAASLPAEPASNHVFPTQVDLAILSAQLPDDPVAAVQALVETVFGSDEFQARVAVGELLRRAGLPLVSISGPVTGIPENLVLVDDPVYVELIPDLTRALRRGNFYTPAQLSDLLLAVGFSTEPMDPHALVAGLGQWGKKPGSPPESLIAGATVRALSGRRLQVLYDGADVEAIRFDPLQVMLMLAHATGQAAPLAKPTSWTAPRLNLFERFMGVQGIARAASAAEAAGPCDGLANLTKAENQDQAQVRAILQDSIKEAWVDFISDRIGETGSKILGAGLASQEKGTAVLSALLLLLGATIQVTPDKNATHFGHPSAPAQHVKVESIAYFDSTIAKEKVACYSLAGIDVPPPGPLKDFRIRWSMDQSFGGPAGQFLRPIPADELKLDSCGSCGEVTGDNGRSILELTPPVENTDPPKTTSVLYGNVKVTASLDKDDIPIKLGDFLGLTNPVAFVAKKTWDLAISAIQKAGLPSQSVNISVGYHGPDIYVSKGETNLFLVYWNGTIKMDIYTCEGLAGNWTGHGGLGAATENFLGSLPEIIGIDIPDTVPDQTQAFHFMINPNAEENVFDITPGVVTGTMRTHILVNSNANIIINRRPARMVGEVEVEFGGSPLATYTFGASTVYPVYWVPEDPRCPSAGAHFEN
ncbi:MAG: hypothetical protein A2X25_15480 [Chloroflexi bacterium GWB2_49_20]|nr:MAG: hypothetical protein A2X25_15480 [Chloroflexi bacterium GWB2_49_20]OGN77468.1 MAG: hypothetical protein A2X26_13710 [Chloroflexi bacterium GWC2_49_37]OGN84828.1 MAG: hypothetical protein A2X27_14740 [Chloroflexi bacterium GWD2_49_16]HCC79249.1 hypothetical protein [Anaerolineae bacterium]